MIMINRKNLHKLPDFKNHIEAKEYFKKWYGKRFVDLNIKNLDLCGNIRKHYCYIEIASRHVRGIKIAEDGYLELID